MVGRINNLNRIPINFFNLKEVFKAIGICGMSDFS